MEENKFAKKTIAIIVGLIVAIIIFVMSIVTIQSQQVGVVTRFGAVNGTVGEGLHLINPFTSDVVKMPISTQKEDVPAAAASKDLQSVSTDLTINYTLEAAHIVDIFRDFKNGYADTIIKPSIQEAVKNATSKYTAEELITKREEVKGMIYEDLKTRLGSHHISVTEVLITNFDFSPSFNAAVEAKVKAEQDALASKNKLEQTKYEAEQQIVSAKAQAESIRIQAEAITSQGGADYVQLQAINKWDGTVPQTMVPGASVPFINLK